PLSPQPPPNPAVPAHGGRDRRGTADGRVAVRTEVGRVPRRAGEPRRRAAAVVAQRATAAALLPGARGGRREAPAGVRARRRDHRRPEGAARVRPGPDAAPSGGGAGAGG